MHTIYYFVVNSSDKSGNSNQSAQLNSTTATQAAASNASVEVTQTPPDGRTPPVISATEEARTTAPAAREMFMGGASQMRILGHTNGTGG